MERKNNIGDPLSKFSESGVENARKFYQNKNYIKEMVDADQKLSHELSNTDVINKASDTELADFVKKIYSKSSIGRSENLDAIAKNILSESIIGRMRNKDKEESVGKDSSIDMESVSKLPGMDVDVSNDAPITSSGKKYEAKTELPAYMRGDENTQERMIQSMEDIKKAYGAEAGAKGQEYQDIKKAMEPVLLSAEQTKNKLAQEADLERKAKVKAEQIETKSIHIDKMLDEYGNLSLNSKRLWNDSSTGNKIIAGIAIMLGEYGAGMGGGENPAQSIIDKAIDRDIKEQEININKAGTSIQMQRGLLSDLNMQLGSMEAAKAALHASILQNVQNHITLAAARSNSAVAMANASAKNAEIEIKKIEYVTAAKEKSRYMLASIESGSEERNKRMMAREYLKIVDPKKLEKNVEVEGLGVYGDINAGQAKADELKEGLSDASSAVKMLDELREFARTDKFKEAGARAEQIQSILKAKLRVFLTGPGVLSESDWKILNEVVANPVDITSRYATEKLQTLQDHIIQDSQMKAKTFGLKIDKDFQGMRNKPFEIASDRISKVRSK